MSSFSKLGGKLAILGGLLIPAYDYNLKDYWVKYSLFRQMDIYTVSNLNYASDVSLFAVALPANEQF
jgi:hypothetical protein